MCSSLRLQRADNCDHCIFRTVCCWRKGEKWISKCKVSAVRIKCNTHKALNPLLLAYLLTGNVGFIKHDKNVQFCNQESCLVDRCQLWHIFFVSLSLSHRRLQPKLFISTLRSCGLEKDVEPMQDTSNKESMLLPSYVALNECVT